MDPRDAKFGIGQIVRHRVYPFRGVIFDVDPTFANTEEWWLAIPEAVRPRKDQPYYHLLAENEQTTYVAYVSEQNLLPDETGKPVRHPAGGGGVRRAVRRPLRAAQPPTALGRRAIVALIVGWANVLVCPPEEETP